MTMTSLQSINPATGDVVGEVPVTPVASITSVTDRARAAAAGWRRLSLAERRDCLASAAPRFLARAEELGALLTREMGKPLNEGIGEVKACGSGLESELAEIVEALEPVVRTDEGVRSTIYHDPHGVCACITPWNFPMLMPHSQVIPALMAGNAVILKPSEETPLIGQAYADILNEVLPPDVLQVIHGDEAQGKALVSGDVDLITFTGSREAGKHILAAASDSLKRVILELGGKDPLIVLDGADIDAAAAFAARNAFRNAGQVCVSTERIYVQRPALEPFMAALIEHTKSMTTGDGMDEGTRVGPMINARQRDHVLGQLDQAISDGATVAFGGDGHTGNWIQPTILTDVTPTMAISAEETFGPVVFVSPVDTEDEAVTCANDTPFGLGAIVFGAPDRARDVARQLTAGMIGVNRSLGGAAGTPWVGARESGYGFHSSPDGHRQFCQVRVVSEPA